MTRASHPLIPVFVVVLALSVGASRTAAQQAPTQQPPAQQPPARQAPALQATTPATTTPQAAAPKAPAQKARVSKARAPKASAPEAMASKWPTVGSWATYRWTSSLTQTVPVVVQRAGATGQAGWSVVQETAPPPPVVVTYSVVRADQSSYTLQITTHEQAEGPPLSVTQVTVDRASGKARRSLIRHPKGVSPTPESGFRPLREADVGQGQRDEITVPAGRFTAMRGTVQGAEVWVSDEVPGVGLVKGVWRQGTLELTGGSAAGARDLFRIAAR